MKSLAIVVSLCFFMVFNGRADVSQASHTTDAARDTIALINHINYVVEVLRTYNNVVALEDEYKKISADNLNLNRIPDKESLDLIREILDVLNSMRMDERKRKRYQQLCLRELSQARQIGVANVIHHISNSLVSGDGLFVDRLLLMPKTVTERAVDEFFEYRKIQQKAKEKLDDVQFDLDTAKMERLHELNKTLLERQWSLVRNYNLDDSLRVTGPNVKAMINCLKDSSKKRCYQRLLPMACVFEVYPPYWHYRTMMALSENEYDDVLFSCEKFERVDKGLFRTDVMAANVSMAKISAYLSKGGGDTNLIHSALQEIRRWNYNSASADHGLFCAMVYLFVLNDAQSAKEVLQPLMARLSAEIESDLVEYCDLFTRDKNVYVPDVGALAQCRMLRLAIDKKFNQKIDIGELKDICGRQTTSSIEKLFYFGMLRITDLWKFAEKDVLQINVNVDGDKIEVGIPVKWFLLGEFETSLELIKNDEVVEVLNGNNLKQKKISSLSIFDSASTQMPYIYTIYQVTPSVLSAINAFRLNLQHNAWPVSIKYEKKQVGNDGLVHFVPTKVEKFMGKDFNTNVNIPPDFWSGLINQSNSTTSSRKNTSRNRDLREFILKKFMDLQDFKEIYVGDDIPKEDQSYKISMQRFGIDDLTEDILVWCRLEQGLWPDRIIIITPDMMYFTGQKNARTALCKKAALLMPPYVHGKLTDISVGERINIFFQKDSMVTGDLYDTKGNRSKKEALYETFGPKVIAALKEIIAKAKELKGNVDK